LTHARLSSAHGASKAAAVSDALARTSYLQWSCSWRALVGRLSEDGVEDYLPVASALATP